MSEILLNKELPPTIANDIATIQAAGSGLLSIINDILDFSKVESGKFELSEVPYMPASLFMDVSSLISLRLCEKPVHFIINANAEMPSCLRGDDVRLRQILTNIIGNAVKYTLAGFIIMDADGTYMPDGRYRLTIKVTDTGIGIREEDLSSLFIQFNRVDTKKNRHITGSGLGLALSRNFARLMEGDITVESQHGKGSVFTITLVQGVETAEPMARIKVEGQKVMLYEPDPLLASSLLLPLKQLGVGHCLCSKAEEIPLQRGVTHVALRRTHFASVRPILNNICHDGYIILLLDTGESADPAYMRYKQMQLPLFCLQIADFLNGESKHRDFRRPGLDSTHIDPMPGVRVLIVDDNATNLQVAKGLMAPYLMDLETAVSGFQAIEMLTTSRYDLIFMDHMMPELDGVETTARIRAMEGELFRTIPIIALTANAILGAKESFLEQGMTDFLAKPIEISKLNKILKTYAAPLVRKDAPIQVKSSHSSSLIRNLAALPAAIDGINMAEVLSVYGDVNIYHGILKTYGEDMSARVPELSLFLERGEAKSFVISIHAIKSASHGVGALALGDAAAKLEHLVNSEGIEAIELLFPPFLQAMQTMVDDVSQYVKTWLSPKEEAVSKSLHSTFDTYTIVRLQDACDNMDYDLAEKILKELEMFDYPETLRNIVYRMRKCCSDFDYTNLDTIVQALTQE